jgi:hypothetical protein
MSGFRILIDNLRRPFTAHPALVGESYGEHMSVAFGVGGRMLAGGLGAIIHGFCPFLCKTTASQTIRKLNDQVTGRTTAPPPGQ